eukprot:snap_masked-scaffold_16-processed-gene-3.22-mRNA-1 protein AED:1.00 eAED:1.00 QI:0/0/0/0/1/1/2/0/62
MGKILKSQQVSRVCARVGIAKYGYFTFSNKGNLNNRPSQPKENTSSIKVLNYYEVKTITSII